MLPRALFLTLARGLSRAAARVRSEDFLLTAAYVGGLATISLGVGLVYLPAGVIVAGGASAASALVYAARSTGGGDA